MPQEVEVPIVVPAFFAESGLAEYDDTLTPDGYTIQGESLQVRH